MKYYLHMLVFFVGFSTMAVQLLAGRLLAPFFGDTVVVWGSIIGVMILALSIGYFFGGILADKLDASKYLLYSVVGFILSLTPLYLLKDVDLFHPLIAAVVLTFLPSLFSGATMPFALVINSKNLQFLGHSYGSLSASSAVGSVLGVFTTVFFLLPLLGLSKSLIFVIVLAILALACMKNYFWFVLVILPFLFIPASSETIVLDESGYYYLNETVDKTVESVYGPVRVLDRDDERWLIVNGGTMATLVKENRSVYSPGWSYLQCMQDLVEDKENVYVVGLGGGIFASNLADLGLEVTAVELNPVVVELAQNYFGASGFEVRIADGRDDLRRNREKYDAITMDVMNFDESAYKVPPHLLTKEYFELVKSRLQNNGLLVVHLPVTSIDPLLPRVENTLLEVFTGYQTQDCGGLQVIATSDGYEKNVPHEGIEILTDDKMLSELK